MTKSSLTVLEYPDKRLSLISEPVTEFDEKLKSLASSMLDLMYQHEGLGLSAPQVNHPIQLIVCELSEHNPLAMVNPAILELLDGQTTTLEGCLSLPGLQARIKSRHARVAIRYQNLDGTLASAAYSGPAAIILQHEIDHLNGITIFDRMDRVQRITKGASWLKKQKRRHAR